MLCVSVSDLAPGQSGVDDMRLLEQKAQQLAVEAEQDKPKAKDKILFVRCVQLCPSLRRATQTNQHKPGSMAYLNDSALFGNEVSIVLFTSLDICLICTEVTPLAVNSPNWPNKLILMRLTLMMMMRMQRMGNRMVSSDET